MIQSVFSLPQSRVIFLFKSGPAPTPFPVCFQSCELSRTSFSATSFATSSSSSSQPLSSFTSSVTTCHFFFYCTFFLLTLLIIHCCKMFCEFTAEMRREHDHVLRCMCVNRTADQTPTDFEQSDQTGYRSWYTSVILDSIYGPKS